MPHIEWTSRAFRVLEILPQDIAFSIIRQATLLEKFPLLGANLDSRFKKLPGLRQIIVRRKIRVIYEFDEFENRVYILSIQNCRQKLPSNRDLKRDETDLD